MKTSRVRRHLFTLRNEKSREEALEGCRAHHPSDPWLTIIHCLVKYDYVRGGYIDPMTRGQPLPHIGIDKI